MNKREVDFKTYNDDIADLFEESKSEFFLLAYYYLKNSPDAQDVISDCFEKLIKNYHKNYINNSDLKEIKLKPLVLVMIKNRCIDILRQKKTRSKINFLNFSFFQNNSAFISKKLDEFDFNSLCSCLSKKDHNLILKHLDGYTYLEIANELGINEKTVKNRIAIAKNKLRTLKSHYLN